MAEEPTRNSSLFLQIQEAMDCMPSLLILDDLHLICPAPGDSPENPNGNSSAALVEFVCDVLDSFRPLGKPALPGTAVPFHALPLLLHQTLMQCLPAAASLQICESFSSLVLKVQSVTFPEHDIDLLAHSN